MKVDPRLWPVITAFVFSFSHVYGVMPLSFSQALQDFCDMGLLDEEVAAFFSERVDKLSEVAKTLLRSGLLGVHLAVEAVLTVWGEQV